MIISPTRVLFLYSLPAICLLQVKNPTWKSYYRRQVTTCYKTDILKTTYMSSISFDFQLSFQNWDIFWVLFCFHSNAELLNSSPLNFCSYFKKWSLKSFSHSSFSAGTSQKGNRFRNHDQVQTRPQFSRKVHSNKAGPKWRQENNLQVRSN